MALKHVRLELARDKDYPQGSGRCGYEFNAPLGEDSKLDRKVLGQAPQRSALSLVSGKASKPEYGHLVRKPGGAWAFHYDVFGDEDDDETGYRFGDEKFVPGEYVSIREHDDKMRTFKVAWVKDV